MTVWVARWIVGIVLCVAGLAKLGSIRKFVNGAIDYRIGPKRVVQVLAPVLPLVEVLLGASLITGLAADRAAMAAAVILLVFLVAVTINLVRGLRVPCHCLSSSTDEVIGPSTAVRLALLTVFSVIVAMSGPSPLFLSRPDLIWGTSLVVSGVVMLLLMTRAEALVGDLIAVRSEDRLRAAARSSAAASSPEG